MEIRTSNNVYRNFQNFNSGTSNNIPSKPVRDLKKEKQDDAQKKTAIAFSIIGTAVLIGGAAYFGVSHFSNKKAVTKNLKIISNSFGEEISSHFQDKLKSYKIREKREILDGFVKKINEIGNDKSKIHETFNNEVKMLIQKQLNNYSENKKNNYGDVIDNISDIMLNASVASDLLF